MLPLPDEKYLLLFIPSLCFGSEPGHFGDQGCCKTVSLKGMNVVFVGLSLFMIHRYFKPGMVLHFCMRVVDSKTFTSSLFPVVHVVIL